MRGKLLCTEQVSPSGCQIDRDSLENVSRQDSKSFAGSR